MKSVLLALLLLACGSVTTKAQSCLAQEDVRQMLARVESPILPMVQEEYENARRTLNLLAQESGGTYYRARKISDLNGVYEQVINDLGKIYSLGYKPTNATRDRSWRWVKVSVVNRTDLVARTRPGYYAQ